MLRHLVALSLVTIQLGSLALPALCPRAGAQNDCDQMTRAAGPAVGVVAESPVCTNPALCAATTTPATLSPAVSVSVRFDGAAQPLGTASLRSAEPQPPLLPPPQA